MNSKIKCVIFDLDGTLVNTIIDLGRACDYLLKNNGMETNWTEDDYKAFVGNGAKLLVDRAFNRELSDDQLEEQYAAFKIKYNEIKMENACIYDGMTEVVNAIKSKGVKAAVCTNKPDKAAKGMIEELFGKDVFDVVLGAVDDLPKKPDTAMPNKILSMLKLSADECIWIGDSSVDIESAENLGCKSIAVTWGFRSVESLLKCSPDYVVNTPEEILSVLKKI
ncbi:MAG: HAD-IA family hydrolase, partial [Eubacterium sp.]|nr:HAD-IA family hydrolase [Eubacterium sp.]